MRKRKTSQTLTDLAYLSRYMSGLLPDQKRLTEIQADYDNLTLLGQLLSAGTDITRMRENFSQLASLLLDQLAREHYKKATLNLGSGARVAIDVLTRNLFERTADIGFLATDEDTRTFAEAVANGPSARDDSEWRALLGARFAEYIAKYSVYHNIIVLSPDGEVLFQHDADNLVEASTDPFIREALTTDAGYVEIFRPTDLLPGIDSPLVYACRIMSADNHRPVGILCLCFRFQDECQRIFESLVAEDDWTIITLLDTSGRIIASSDPYQFPIGVRIEPVSSDDCRIIRFNGREYLATSRHAHGYQGYSGPGWFGHAMAPINHAFEMSEAHELDDVAQDLLDCVLETTTLFSEALRNIPLQAARIQQELNRAVWNGHIWLACDAAAHNAEFAKVLLREIGSTGVRTRNVYNESTTNLYKTVVSSVMFDCATQAALAIDIMDRNLYERANDCRWWALARTFREELSSLRPHDDAQQQQLTTVLRTINGLYTVYDNLILFDRTGVVVAVSNSAYSSLIGQQLTEDWVRPTLGLKNTQSYCVSNFAATQLYAGRHTYVYSAAVRHMHGNDPVGGIAIVFDATPQFQAMLRDSLPRQTDGSVFPGAFAVFAERDGRVVSSTASELPPGTHLDIPARFLELQPGESHSQILVYRERYYAVGACMRAGYREYDSEGSAKASDVAGLVFTPLSERVIASGRLPTGLEAPLSSQPPARTRSADAVDIASFYIGHDWYGLPSTAVVEAIDVAQLTLMPGSSAWTRGFLMYKDRAVTIFDLTEVVVTRRPEQERRHRETDNMQKPQVLILRTSDDRARFGILVDRLGDIAEISASRIEGMSEFVTKSASLMESIVKPLPGDNERRILVVLSADKLLRRLIGRGVESGITDLPASDASSLAVG